MYQPSLNQNNDRCGVRLSFSGRMIQCRLHHSHVGKCVFNDNDPGTPHNSHESKLESEWQQWQDEKKRRKAMKKAKENKKSWDKDMTIESNIPPCTYCGAGKGEPCKPGCELTMIEDTEDVSVGATTNTGGHVTTYMAKCRHKPTIIMRGEVEKGEHTWEVWAGTKDKCEAYLDNFDIVLNCTYSSIVESNWKGHKITIPALAKYDTRSKPNKYKCVEMHLDWDDGKGVELSGQFWIDLLNYIQAEKKKLLVFCTGGHGRTGTALACLFVAGGWDGNEAQNWIWEHYCKEAIETKEQQVYIAKIENEINPEKFKAIEAKQKAGEKLSKAEKQQLKFLREPRYSYSSSNSTSSFGWDKKDCANCLKSYQSHTVWDTTAKGWRCPDWENNADLIKNTPEGEWKGTIYVELQHWQSTCPECDKDGPSTPICPAHKGKSVPEIRALMREERKLNKLCKGEVTSTDASTADISGSTATTV